MSSSQPLDQLWRRVSDKLRPRIAPDAYNRWFSSIRLLEAVEDRVVVLVPDGIHQLWIEMNYLPPLREAFWSVTGLQHEIVLQVSQEARPPQDNRTVAELTAEPELPALENPESAPRDAGMLPMDLPEPVVQAPAAGRPRARREEQNDPVVPEGAQPSRTFETYVVGANNQFAHAAAVAVAAAPASAYNPFFISGATGLGKTHLLHAIGTEILRTRPKLKVRYVTSEDFTNQFIEALQTNSISKFRALYRSADVLLIDDIQFLAGRERSQEEFFHTFNALFDGHKQIVLTSDRAPGQINGLEKRLVSRFEWGLIAELTPPDYETRLAILRHRAAALKLDVPPDVLEFVAERIRSNMRRLHGAIYSLGSWISLHGTPRVRDAEEILREVLADEAKNQITIDRIQRIVAEHYDIRLADMTSRRRPALIALARQIAMWFSRECTGTSYVDIGEAFGGRDHATVMHACRVVEQRMQADEQLRHTIANIERELKRSTT